MALHGGDQPIDARFGKVKVVRSGVQKLQTHVN